MLVIEMPNATNDFIQEMLMGNFNFEIRNESSEVEGIEQSQYGDEGAIMGDDEEGCDESDPDSSGDR